MKWEKIGQIFETEAHGFDYAKSPQAVVLDDRVRIYFSTCRPDGDKLLSYVAFVDFDLSLRRVLRTSSQVLEDGGLGCFDEHGIFPFSPVEVDGTLYGYTSGWSRRQSVSVETAIGLCVSMDYGETFQRLGPGPVLAASLEEPFLVVDGFVRKYEDIWHMWYIFGTDWTVFHPGEAPDRIYKIGHAVSGDGVTWKREGRRIIPDKIEYESQALPSVVQWHGWWHMAFCYRYSHDFRENRQRGYRLGYAVSDDLVHWTRDDACLALPMDPEAWDGQMMCYPHLFSWGDTLYLLYNGNRFGKYGFGAARLIKE